MPPWLACPPGLTAEALVQNNFAKMRSSSILSLWQIRRLISTVRQKYEALAPLLHEKARRCWAACEALALGRGGISLVATATELSRPTIRRGIAELQTGDSGPVTIGPTTHGFAGPEAAVTRSSATDGTLIQDLKRLIDPATRGDPMSPLLWTCKSTRNLADALTVLGHDLSHQTVGRMLVDLGYSLQANRKTEEGKDHPDRNAQFEHINAQSPLVPAPGPAGGLGGYQEEGNRGKLQESGREWEPRGQPRRVKSKDFPDKELGKVAPYGVYDLTADEGWVSVGIDHDTAEFAVESLRRWWCRMGTRAYPGGEGVADHGRLGREQREPQSVVEGPLARLWRTRRD